MTTGNMKLQNCPTFTTHISKKEKNAFINKQTLSAFNVFDANDVLLKIIVTNIQKANLIL